MRQETEGLQERLPQEQETLLFRIAVSQPTVMAAPVFEADEACRCLVDEGYVNCERFGGVPRSVVCLTASIKGLHYCCDRVDEMDEETLGFLPLF